MHQGPLTSSKISGILTIASLVSSRSMEEAQADEMGLCCGLGNSGARQ
jgi:hypothetical protein